MAKICYIPRKFSPAKALQIQQANEIISDYQAMGYDLTVRQLYYQFVSRNLIANQPTEYSKLQSLLNDARLAGLVDWDAIVDRTRNLRAIKHYAKVWDPIAEARDSFHFWKWENQPNYVEVWVEKDALLGVIGQACNPLDVPFFSCRGYTSVTEVHAAALRFKMEIEQGKTIRVIHLGDHDPSGLDMTRDIKNRLNMVFGVDAKIYRCALNKNQVEEHNLPPNPAKETDSRSEKYMDEHGESSWELDALDPQTLSRIITNNILHWRDDALWDAACFKEQRARNVLGGIIERWNEVYKLIREAPEPSDE